MSSSYREAVDHLAARQKTAKGAPAYSRFVNRPLGRRLAAAAYVAGLTPNQVTVLSGACSAAGIALIALTHPAPLVGVLVSLALVLGYALDSADGQLARLRGGGSPAGEWLDHMVDATKIGALHLAVLVWWARDLSDRSDRLEAQLLIPIGFTLVATVLFFAMVLTDQLRRAQGGSAVAAVDAPASPLRAVLVAPTDYGLVCVFFLTLGWPQLFRVGYAAFFLANAAFLLLATVKWFREVSAFGRGEASQSSSPAGAALAQGHPS